MNATPYWKWDQAIPEGLLQQLEADLADYELQHGTLDGERPDDAVRNSDVQILPPWHWMCGVLLNYGIAANELAGWSRTITRPEICQVATYGEGQFYKWHSDVNELSLAPLERKLTAICLLSDVSEFAGGELELMFVKDDLALKRGSVIVFPSGLVHRVQPVLSGVRKSATCWILGPNTH